MKDINLNSSESLPPKKRGRKPFKDKMETIPGMPLIPIVPTTPIVPEKTIEPINPENGDMSKEELLMSQAIANIIQNSVEKYSEIAEKQLKTNREDFDNLQPIVSEFLDDFIIIGHTLEGRRVVMRYTATPADLDKLTELCKKVLVRMMIEEQNGK